MSKYIRKLDNKISRLTKKRYEISNGGELCKHRYNSRARVIECFCTGCSEQILGVADVIDVPLRSDAYCSKCKETAEVVRLDEIKLLKELKLKYPEI